MGPEDCESSVVILIPVEFVDPSLSGRVVGNGFKVRWKVDDEVYIGCTQSSGQCMYDNGTLMTGCGCPEQPLLADSCDGVNKTRVESSLSSTKKLFWILISSKRTLCGNRD
uniref:Wall-associated receptor kinase C-terminal domain-containing protein n=1 Tax=Lactuca sativa TaxID=4236 RepID=A0A9R1XUV6_LACSA|nr:hypothetical protein LSAT_V11C200063650 [Lactuca sativa]